MIDVAVGWTTDAALGARWVVTMTFLYILAFTLSAGPVAQLPITFLFLFTCPGALLVDWLDLPSRPTVIALVVTTSLAVNIVIATLLVGTGSYSPFTGLITTALGAMTAAIISILKDPNTQQRRSLESPILSG